MQIKMNDVTEQDQAEMIRRVDGAAFEFGRFSDAVLDIRVIFEAIKAASAADSLQSRLSDLGMNLCDSNTSDLNQRQDEYHGYAAAYVD